MVDGIFLNELKADTPTCNGENNSIVTLSLTLLIKQSYEKRGG